jgi:hypothetical protein
MAVPLLAYFGTMVSAFVSLMLLLNSFLTSSMMERVRSQPYPRLAIEESVAAAAPPSASNKQIPAADVKPEESHSAAGEQASAEKSKLVNVARAQVGREVARKKDLVRTEDLTRREDSAGRRQDHEYSTAQGYAQEAPQQPAFNLFGSNRF